MNVNDDGDTTASPSSAEVTFNTTSAIHQPSSATVKLSESPVSDTVAVGFETVTPTGGDPDANSPDDVNFVKKTPPELMVKLTVPGPGSKSTVNRDVPVVYTFPDPSTVTSRPT